MPLDPSWHPKEDKITIFNERTWMAGMAVSCVAYGIVLTIFLLSFTQFVRTTTWNTYHTKLPFLIYISLMLIFATLFIGAIAKMTELSFIDYRLYPGGPSAFETMEFSIPIDEISNVSYVLANWLADGMVIYRYIVIYKSCRQFPIWFVMSIPVLAYLASISFSVVWLVQVSAPSSSPWRTSTVMNFTAPYFWMSLSLNISMTIAICARLFFHRWNIAKVLGPHHGTQYITVAAVLVESSFLYSAFALLFLVPYAINNPIQNVFIQLLGEVQIIAALLIAYRIAYGDAWVDGASRNFTKKDNHIPGVPPQVDFSRPNTQRDRNTPGYRTVSPQANEYEIGGVYCSLSQVALD